MSPTWITVFLTVLLAITAGLGVLVRVTVTEANFFTYRYRLVLQARKDRLDIAQQLAYIGEDIAAQAQIDAANRLVAKTIILTETVPAHRGRIHAGIAAYITFICAITSFVFASFLPHFMNAWFALAGVVFLFAAVTAIYVLTHLIDKDDKRARHAALERAARFTNPDTYYLTTDD